ncbi:MAG: hypothetical protein ACK5B9_08035 [Flavobacteriia bacterium]|jgi:hypothetical protein
MKNIDQIRAEIEKNKVDRKKFWVEFTKHPNHLDFLTDPETETSAKTITTPLIIKRHKKYLFLFCGMWIIILGITTLGQQSKSNFDFLAKALDFEFIPLLIFLGIFIVWPVSCLILLFKKKTPAIINDNYIQLSTDNVLNFSDIIFICFVKKRQQKVTTLNLKFYLISGDEIIHPVEDWDIEQEDLGRLLYNLMKANKQLNNQ